MPMIYGNAAVQTEVSAILYGPDGLEQTTVTQLANADGRWELSLEATDTEPASVFWRVTVGDAAAVDVDVPEGRAKALTSLPAAGGDMRRGEVAAAITAGDVQVLADAVAADVVVSDAFAAADVVVGDAFAAADVQVLADAATAGDAAYLRVADAIFDVRNYGAVGDGTTNDTAAIQAAIDACATAGGGVVLLPVGRYSVTTLTVSTTQHGVTIAGQSPFGCVLEATAAATGAVLEVGDLTGVATGARRFGLRDVQVTAKPSHTQRGVHMGRVLDGPNLTNVRVGDPINSRGVGSHGIHLVDTVGFTLDRCVVDFAGGDGIRLEIVAAAGGINAGRIIASSSRQNGANGLTVTQGGSAGLSYHLQVFATLLESNTAKAFELDGCHGVTVSGCHLEGNGAASTFDGLSGTFRDLVLLTTGITIGTDGYAAHFDGCHFAPAAPLTISSGNRNISLTNCTYQGTDPWACVLDSSADLVVRNFHRLTANHDAGFDILPQTRYGAFDTTPGAADRGTLTRVVAGGSRQDRLLYARQGKDFPAHYEWADLDIGVDDAAIADTTFDGAANLPPTDGSRGIDTANHRWYVKSGGTWRYTPLGKFFTGTGSPEGVLTAGVGALYTRSDGGAGTTLYVKESGTGNTGWAAK